MQNGSGSFRLKKLIKQVGSPLLDALGVFDRSIERLRADSSAWTILMYHRVIRDARDDPFEMGMCVRLPHFEQQIAYLRTHFNVTSISEVAERLHRGEALAPGTVSITFDDGYLDNLTVAAPVLERHGMPWSLYVTTGGIDSGASFWWDRVIRAVALTPVRRLDLEKLPAAFGGGALSLTRSHRRTSLLRLLDVLWSLPIEVTLACVSQVEEALIQGLAADCGPQAPRLSVAQLRELVARGGVEIGAHSVRHPNLAAQPIAEVVHEMHESRRCLESLLDQAIPGFVYPGGRMSGEVIEQARSAGFRYALSTESRINDLPCDLMQLGRIGMPDSSAADFRRALHNQMSRLPAGGRSGGPVQCFSHSSAAPLPSRPGKAGDMSPTW